MNKFKTWPIRPTALVHQITKGGRRSFETDQFCELFYSSCTFRSIAVKIDDDAPGVWRGELHAYHK